MVLLGNKLDSIFKNSITTPILDTMIEKDSANPLVNDLTKKINTSLLSIKKDLNEAEDTNLTESNKVEAELLAIKNSIEALSKRVTKLEEDLDYLDSIHYRDMSEVWHQINSLWLAINTNGTH